MYKCGSFALLFVALFSNLFAFSSAVSAQTQELKNATANVRSDYEAGAINNLWGTSASNIETDINAMSTRANELVALTQDKELNSVDGRTAGLLGANTGFYLTHMNANHAQLIKFKTGDVSLVLSGSNAQVHLKKGLACSDLTYISVYASDSYVKAQPATCNQVVPNPSGRSGYFKLWQNVNFFNFENSSIYSALADVSQYQNNIDREPMSPTLEYRVRDKDLYLQDITPQSAIDEFSIVLCLFQLPDNRWHDNFTEYTYDCENPAVVHHTFNEYATYNIMIRHRDHNNIWYETTQMLTIDGSSYDGTIGGMVESVYEDCDLTDILCHFRNAWAGLRNLFSYLFVPSWLDVRVHFNNLAQTAGRQLGFLYDSFAMLGSAFNLIITTTNPDNNSTCPIPLTFFGASAEVKLCAWRHQQPQMWNLMQKAIQAGISLGLVYVFWRKFNKMTGREVEDGTDIELNPAPYEGVHWVDERTGERGKIK